MKNCANKFLTKITDLSPSAESRITNHDLRATNNSSRVTDMELVKQFQNGDVKGFNELMRRYQEKVYWIARRIVVEHDDADDVAQDVFVKVYEALKNFRGDAEFFTWVYRITTNISLNFLRSKKVKSFLRFNSNDEENESDREAVLFEDTDVMNRPDAILEHKELKTMIEKAVETLPKQQRVVFMMRHYDELSYEEISKELNISTGGLKANYFHALKKIQKFLSNALQRNSTATPGLDTR